MNYDDDDDDFYNEIIRLRHITRRTNWRLRSTSLSQRDVALLASIQSSLSFYLTFMYMVLFHLNHVYQSILHNNDRQSFIFGRLLRALKNYQCLFTFCCHEIDILLEDEADLSFLRRHQLPPLTTGPPRNRVINELTDEVAYSLTRFTKEQLRLLFAHFRMPEVIVTEHRHHFSGEEVLIVCLAKIATGDPWIRLIPGFFGGDVRRWSFAFRWFVDHLFINFFHKISGRSIEIWLPEMNGFKQSIIERLRQPAHPIEMDYYYDAGERDGPNQYIVEVESIDDWRVFGFIDDTAVRTCRVGSGPVGPEDGPGRPRRQFADLIQRSFYR
jgi:hypothetical protein